MLPCGRGSELAGAVPVGPRQGVSLLAGKSCGKWDLSQEAQAASFTGEGNVPESPAELVGVLSGSAGRWYQGFRSLTLGQTFARVLATEASYEQQDERKPTLSQGADCDLSGQ